ncbi:MAG: DUF3109 family protein [Bacteroidetes bacterium]|nr:DUF3109 family protein [Bacteroidota bacterium]
MIRIDNTLISEEIGEIRFCCDLSSCKGACCVEGDAGAPLTEEEISLLEDHIDEINPFMTSTGIEAVEYSGVFDYDMEGHFVTPLVNGRECVFIFFEDGIARCAIEKAHTEGVIPFQKPLSCHLYPIRITCLPEYQAVNYHQWPICRDALENGKKLNLSLVEFLRDALVRKFGKAWYGELLRQLQRRQQ